MLVLNPPKPAPSRKLAPPAAPLPVPQVQELFGLQALEAWIRAWAAQHRKR